MKTTTDCSDFKDFLSILAAKPRFFCQGMLVCHQAFYARTDIAKNLQYDTRYRYSADVDWCIRVMKEADRLALPLCNTGMVVANYLEEGETTRHHQESLRERYQVMCRHYGRVSTFFMHCWFLLRNIITQLSEV